MVEIKEEFRYRLDKALAEANMRPIDLVRATGISESAISQYRKGMTKPKDKRLVKIANVLNVNPSWLMGLDVPMRNNEDDFVVMPSDSAFSKNEIQLVEMYRSLNQEGQEKLIGYADDLISTDKYKKTYTNGMVGKQEL